VIPFRLNYPVSWFTIYKSDMSLLSSLAVGLLTIIKIYKSGSKKLYIPALERANGLATKQEAAGT
jgi:hypothetical protein